MYTTSMCSTCYQVIPARIVFTPQGVEMIKECGVHGTQHSLVERDIEFFKSSSYTNIYKGHFVDITGKCQLQCKYCYHEDGKHKAMAEIVSQLVAPAPYFLIGGEPTIHPNFIEIADEVCRYGETGVVTNFVRFMDRKFLLRAFRRLSPFASGISWHKESGFTIQDICNVLCSVGLSVSSLLVVIDSMDELPVLVEEMLKTPKQCFQWFRIKLASKVWNTKEDCGLFVSDVLKWFAKTDPRTTINPNHKYDYTEFSAFDRMFAVIKWQNIHNVNLPYICGDPTMVAKDGSVNNLALSFILNERRYQL